MAALGAVGAAREDLIRLTQGCLKMTRGEQRLYAKAMGVHAIRSALETLEMLTTTGMVFLCGVQLSGILNTQNVIGVQPFFAVSGVCGGSLNTTALPQELINTIQTLFGVSVGGLNTTLLSPEAVNVTQALSGYCRGDFNTSVPLNTVHSTQTLGDTLDHILILPLNTLTYLMIAFRTTFRLSFPPLKQYLFTKEDAWLRKITPRSVSLPAQKAMTRAAKISTLIDLVLPALFTGVQMALSIRVIEAVGSKFSLPGSDPFKEILSGPGFNATVVAQIQQVLMNTLSGEDSFSNEDLILLLVCGCLLYVTQAWYEFKNDFQTKAQNFVPPLSEPEENIQHASEVEQEIQLPPEALSQRVVVEFAPPPKPEVGIQPA